MHLSHFTSIINIYLGNIDERNIVLTKRVYEMGSYKSLVKNANNIYSVIIL